jgi:hypothetical protein
LKFLMGGGARGAVCAALAVCGLLAGCQREKPIAEMTYTEVKVLAAQIGDRCEAQGAKRGTPSWDICTKQEANREDALRTRRSAGGGGGPTVCNTFGATTVCN